MKGPMDTLRSGVVALVAGLCLASACAPETQELRPTQMPTQLSVEVPGMARVVLRKTARDIFEFDVTNLSDKFLNVDRDAVALVGPGGARQPRVPGGAERFYNLPPGATHKLNVRFNLTPYGKGDAIAVDFNGALHLNNEQPFALEPIHTYVE
jgi:hypothetical protein